MRKESLSEQNDVVGYQQSDEHMPCEAGTSSSIGSIKLKIDQQNAKKFGLVLSVFAVICMALSWFDVVELVEGEWRLKPWREQELDKQVRKLQEAEQYALVASKPGWYDCIHCPNAKVFLLVGHVWKYGVTVNGENVRYTASFLNDKSLSYRVDYIGNYHECLVAEKKQLFNYPLLPENIARPDSLKLILPPGNAQLR